MPRLLPQMVTLSLMNGSLEGQFFVVWSWWRFLVSRYPPFFKASAGIPADVLSLRLCVVLRGLLRTWVGRWELWEALQDSGVSRVVMIEEGVKIFSPMLKYSLFVFVQYCTVCRSDRGDSAFLRSQ